VEAEDRAGGRRVAGEVHQRAGEVAGALNVHGAAAEGRRTCVDVECGAARETVAGRAVDARARRRAGASRERFAARDRRVADDGRTAEGLVTGDRLGAGDVDEARATARRGIAGAAWLRDDEAIREAQR